MISVMVYIFDFFGVISSEVVPFWFAEHLPNQNVADLRKQYIDDADLGNTSLSVLYRKLAKLTNQTVESITQQWTNLAVINNNVIDLIEKLNKDNRVALLSNSPADLIRPILKKHDLERLFEVIIISGEVGMVKPNQDIYLYTLKKLDTIPKETFFIDDSQKNVEVADSLGMNTILYKDFSDIAGLAN